MTDQIDKAKDSIISREPTMIAWTSAAVAGAAGTYLFAHFGLNVDATKQFVEPAVTGVLLVVFGFLNRRAVVPVATFAKKVESEVERRLNAAPSIDGAEHSA